MSLAKTVVATVRCYCELKGSAQQQEAPILCERTAPFIRG